jgi:hypothetical protein
MTAVAATVSVVTTTAMGTPARDSLESAGSMVGRSRNWV